VKPGGDFQQLLLDRLQHPAQAAVQLGGGVSGRGGGLRVDQVHHRLRLGQVHPAVQKRPLGELPRLGLPGPGSEEGRQQLPQHHGGAVAVKLCAVLPGVAARPREPHRKAPVNDPA
ncbi:putative conserved protein, contains double-stranded beta-helix domain, partial [Dysosmobacter welbionis]